MQAGLFEALKNGNFFELLLCENDKEADWLSQVPPFFGIRTFVLPDFRAEFGDDLRAFSGELFKICEVLSAYHKEEGQKILIIPLATALKRLPHKHHLQGMRLELGENLDPRAFSEELLRMGYEVVDMVQDRGELSLRGEVLDIFCIDGTQPVRILLDGERVESVRFFDLQTQKTIPTELKSLEICPFLMHFSKEDYERLEEKLQNFQSAALIKDRNSLGLWCVEDFFDYLSLDFKSVKKFNANEWEQSLTQAGKNLEFIHENILAEPQIYKDLEASYSKDFFALHQNKPITILAKNEALFKQLDLPPYLNISLVKSPLRLHLISPSGIILSLNPKPKKNPKPRSKLLLEELKSGDFITHSDYGVGKFLGLEMLQISGARREFVALSYQNNDKLLLPVENLHHIDKYHSTSGNVPVLDRLGKSTFIKLKERLKTKLLALASQLVELAAKRALIPAKNIRVDWEEQAHFMQSAGFSHTEDQMRACEAILEDFQSARVMDRLLSGDVGFGKTEVAMNAIYPVVKSGFCAFFFVPTTLLSHQHFKSLKKRFEPFKINVFKLDRFTNSKDKKALLENLERNKPCVVVGTHALLSVECENLALVIVDEEHKFGVKQKEKLKNFSQNAHILSMSATPIPRSLNQALSKVKTYSVLQTPPEDRQDVRSFVREKDDALIKEAILRELRRGGQIFYIHNHIASIEESAKFLKSLLSGLRILILHSKIDAKSTEEAMLKFEEGAYDLLLCTSIVESGIDLPRVNTILIENAQNFGMADLHQLRGRVGRRELRGYCYFLVEDKQNLSEQALRRLVSLESNSYLGAGSVLAYHDLEIRGGGNLLGQEQSGHIEQVGLSLYLKMLEDALNALSKNENLKENKLDLKLAINAFLNPDLIREDSLRLELYRRLSRCEDAAAVYAIEAEIEDRFGRLDAYTKQFLALIHIKILASGRFRAISNYAQNITLIALDEGRITLKARSRDDEDILETLLVFLRKD